MASYNERLMYNILVELGIPFIKEFHFEGFSKRYDFLIEGVGIVELHGGQHYNRPTTGVWINYEKEHNNDLYKYDLAVNHGYNYKDNYFIINCNSSSHNTIYNNICKELGHLLPLATLDKDKVMKESEKDETTIYCEYWENNGHPTPKEMSNVFNVHFATILEHLKNGHDLGLCSYTTELAYKEQWDRQRNGNHPMQDKKHKKESKQKMKESHIKYRGFKGTDVKTGEIIYITSDRHELKNMGFQYAHIVKCCNGERKTHKGYKWEVCD